MSCSAYSVLDGSHVTSILLELFMNLDILQWQTFMSQFGYLIHHTANPLWPLRRLWIVSVKVKCQKKIPGHSNMKICKFASVNLEIAPMLTFAIPNLFAKGSVK